MTSANGVPHPPGYLKAAGRSLWADVTGAFAFEPHELHTVEMAAAHKDAWWAAVRKRRHGEARAEAVVVARLLRELRLNQVEESRPPGLERGRVAHA